jgi:hypothetical protein
VCRVGRGLHPVKGDPHRARDGVEPYPEDAVAEPRAGSGRGLGLLDEAAAAGGGTSERVGVLDDPARGRAGQQRAPDQETAPPAEAARTYGGWAGER